VGDHAGHGLEVELELGGRHCVLGGARGGKRLAHANSYEITAPRAHAEELLGREVGRALSSLKAPSGPVPGRGRQMRLQVGDHVGVGGIVSFQRVQQLVTD
jgi:hypothetical protein